MCVQKNSMHALLYLPRQCYLLLAYTSMEVDKMTSSAVIKRRNLALEFLGNLLHAVETNPRNKLGLGIGYMSTLCDVSHHCFPFHPWRQVRVTSFGNSSIGRKSLTCRPSNSNIKHAPTCLPTSTPLDNTEAKKNKNRKHNPHIQTYYYSKTPATSAYFCGDTHTHTHTYHLDASANTSALSPNLNLEDTSSSIHANVWRTRSISLVLACLQHTSDADITAY